MDKMAEIEPDAIKVSVKGELVALPWELIPPEIVMKALELKAVRLEGLPPLLQQAVIELGFRPPDNADENTVQTAMQELSGANAPPTVDLVQPAPNQLLYVPRSWDIQGSLLDGTHLVVP